MAELPVTEKRILRTFFMSPKFVGLGILGSIVAAFQSAGVASVPFAIFILAFGVWGFSVAEVWFAEWLKKTGPYWQAVILFVTCAVGIGTVGIAALINDMKRLQATTITNTGAEVAKRIPLETQSEPPSHDNRTLPIIPRPKSPATGDPKKDKVAAVRPDVGLRFVYSKSPALVIVNLSESVARDIKWTVLLWNMDLPDRNDPLPIPTSAFDWIRANDRGGPQSLFSGASVSSLVKTGDRLFGSASVDCPDCARSRAYVVYIVWGETGWFAEFDLPGKPGKAVIPASFLKERRYLYFKELESAIPSDARVPIGEQ